MKQSRNNRKFREWAIVCCPPCFWAFFAAQIHSIFGYWFGVLFPSMRYQNRFCNPIFAPMFMPLGKMFQLLLGQIPFARMRRVRRTVAIPMKGQLMIRIDVMAAPWITDSELLTALTVYKLNDSPELKRLPRWMRRVIKSRAYRMGQIAKDAACKEMVRIGSSESIFSLGVGKISSLEFHSVSRCLLWKGSMMVARSITHKGLEPKNFLSDNIHLLHRMPIICAEMIGALNQLDRRLGILFTYMFISLERQYPCFFYTKAGKRLLSAFYAVAGYVRIFQKSGAEICCLTQQVLSFYKRGQMPLSLAQTEEETAPKSALGLPSVLSGLNVEGLNAFPTMDEDSLSSLTEKPGTPGPSSHPKACACGKCRSGHAMPMRSQSAARAAAPLHGTDAPGGAGKGASGQSMPEEEIQDILQATLAESYEKVTGRKAPRFVKNAGVLDNEDKANPERKINRYHGNTPAASLEAMLELFALMFPGCYITDFVKAGSKGEKDTIYLHSDSKENRDEGIVCPCCGKRNRWVKDAKTRTMQDLSIRNGVGTQLAVTMGRAFCDNPECSNNNACYYEQCAFAKPSKTHTIRVDYLALVTGASSSFHDAEHQLRLLGIQFSDDSLKDLLMSLSFSDEKDVKIIGMDDVSTCKGKSYVTIIYNMENGHMLKLIDGRSGRKFEAELTNWLDEHPGIRIICRDRSSSYGCVISRYCRLHKREIIQVADRFHLLQNLSDHLKEAYYEQIPERIAFRVDKDDKGRDKVVFLEEIPKLKVILTAGRPEAMDGWHYDNSMPIDKDGKPIKLGIYVDRRSENKIQAKLRENKALAEKILKVRQDYDAMGRTFAWGEKKSFLEEHHISDYYFNKYISMTDKELEDLKSSWMPSTKRKLFDNYQYLAYKMLRDGRSISDVFWYIKEVTGGWSGSDKTLVEYLLETYKKACPTESAPYLEDLIKEEYPDGAAVVDRQQLFYALMTLDGAKKDEKLAPYLDAICQEYPACGSIRSIFREFHDIIIVDKDMDKRTPEKCREAVEKLHQFIAEHKVKEDPLCGFASSLYDDKECIANAICMRESSGAVEGRNCKYKCYLRRYYGHISFETLEQMLKLGFMYTSKGFTFDKIAPGLLEELPA